MDTEKTLKKLTPGATINQIVSNNRNTAKLLSSIGLNPEHYQNQTLRSACQQLQWNEEELMAWIKKHHEVPECIKNEPEDPDFGENIVEWCNWMSDSMQPCIRELLTAIADDLPRVQLVHGNQYTWLKNIESHFNTMKEILERYLLLEQETLFPLVKELNHQGESILYGKAKNLKRSLEVLEDDRTRILKEIRLIRDFSNHYQHPAGACSTLRIMNKNLADLDWQLEKYFSIEKESIFSVVKKQLSTA